MPETLSPEAQEVVNQYLALPGIGISAPYFNNRTLNQRASLRGLIGKGTPEELAEEYHLLLVKRRRKLDTMTTSERIAFAVENGLGIDCSGFVYHVLDAQCHAQTNKNLRHFITSPHTWNLMRRFIAHLRTAENTSVAVLAYPANSFEVPVKDARAGDIITLTTLDRSQRARDHVVIIDSVTRKENKVSELSFIHAIRWPEDGLYNHGLKKGVIKVTDLSLPIHQQQWSEVNRSDSPTLTARKDLNVTLRRLRAFA